MSKALVTFFSAEGTTEKVAKRIAEKAEADIFEIKPEMPYSKADINWKNPLSRCNREKIGRKDVPISEKIENFGEYDGVFIGFPIWYYGAPNIINTFIKEYDWSGKKIALFATSGGSGMGKTAEKVKPLFEGKGEIIAAELFNGAISDDEIKKWVDEAMTN